MNEKKQIEFSILTLILVKLTEDSSKFYQRDFFQQADVKDVSKHVCQDFLITQTERGCLKKERDHRPTRGAPPIYYIKLSPIEERICAKCLDKRVYYYCSHCGARICKHHSENVAKLLLCQPCSNKFVVCISCISRVFMGVRIGEEDPARDLGVYIPHEEDGIQYWVCPNEYCEDFGRKRPTESLHARMRTIDWQNIREQREEYERLNAIESEFTKKQEEYVASQGTLLKGCDHADDCLEGDCPLVHSDDATVICPNGLPCFGYDCLHCEDCEYFRVEKDLSPWDEEFDSPYCEFLHVATYSEEQ